MAPDPGGPGEPEGGAVAVVDEPHVVGRADHVEVEVQGDVGPLGVGQAGDVEVRADQARLLGAPPGEAHGVGGLDLAHLLGHLEDGRAARAVVVDAGTGEHRVEVGADHHDVAVVAAGEVSASTLKVVLISRSVLANTRICRPGVPASCCTQCVGGAEHRDAAGVVGGERDRRDALAAGVGGLALVEDHDADGTGGGGVLGLDLERAACPAGAGRCSRRGSRRSPRPRSRWSSVAEAELQVDRR